MLTTGLSLKPALMISLVTIKYRLTKASTTCFFQRRVEVRCSDIELLWFHPNGTTCGSFMALYMTYSGGYLVDGTAVGTCECCPIWQTDVYLDLFLRIRYDERWRNLGLLWAYTVFNALAALLLYWLARVPKGSKKEGRVVVVKA